MDEKTVKSVEGISRAATLQNDAVLRAMLFPQICQQQSGYFEDPHGQTIYMDGNGVTHRPQRPDDLNGWTV